MYYRIENIMDDKDNLTRLAHAGFSEVEHAMDGKTLSIDWEQYAALNTAGQVRYYTISTEQGVKVGYAVFIIIPSLHYRGAFHAVSDAIYIEPAHRGCGTEFLQLIINDLQQENVDTVSIHFKTNLDNGVLASRLGCVHYENVYFRSLK